MKHISIIFLFLIASCNRHPDEDIDKLIKSNEPDNLIKAFYLIGEQKTLKYIPLVLADVYDPRITHDINFKGISVYQSKMIALEKLSGITPPKEITFKPDSVIVNFYGNWASKNNLLK